MTKQQKNIYMCFNLKLGNKAHIWEKIVSTGYHFAIIVVLIVDALLQSCS